MDVIDFIEKFQLDTLPDSWPDSVWESEFDEEKELPPAYGSREEIDFLSLLSDFSDFIRHWIKDTENISDSISGFSDSSVGRKSWHTLITKEVNHKGLIAVISTFIKRETKELKSQNDVNLALQASRLYFMLISIDGAHIFNLFNSTLFCQAIDTLKVLKVILSEEGNEKKNSKAKKNQDGGKQSGEKNRNKNNEEQELDDIEEETENFTLIYNNQEKNKLIKSVLAVLNDLEYCLESIDEKCTDGIIKHTVQNLLLIATLEKTTNIFTAQLRTNDVAYLSYKSFEILLNIVQLSSNSQEENVRFVMIKLLDYLSPGSQDFISYPNLSRSLNVMRHNILEFLFRIVSKVEKQAYKGLIILIQQLFIRTPEKADVRAKYVSLITSILERGPLTVFNQLLFWIVSCCWDDSPTYRLIAVDILSSLLYSAHKHKHLYQSQDFNSSESLSDTYSSLHSDAVTSEYSSSLPQNVTPRRSSNSEQTSNNPLKVPDSPGSVPRSSVSSKKTSAGSALNTSASPSSLKRNSSSVENPFCLNVILSAIVSLCKDLSPKVRARALSSLSTIILLKDDPVLKCVMETFVIPYDSLEVIDKVIAEDKKFFDFRTYLKNLSKSASPGCLVSINLNYNPMPGGSFIMDQVEKFTNDDKVSVRKAALSVICNICLISGKWLTTRRLELITESCRDSSLIIRKHMISCLTDLVLTYPTKDLLVAAWVNGIFPLLGDNEATSEEKVLEAITKLIIENMDHYNKSITPHSTLPWKIISLICEKGQRKMFRLVCRHWKLSNKIRSNHIKILKSHIGSVNHLGALFLLVSIAEYQEIESPDFLLDNYFNKIYNSNETNEYESYLIMEGIFLSLNTIDEENKAKLCSTINDSIFSFSVPLILISRYIDIYHKCYPNEIKEWSRKLVQECESGIRRIIDGNIDDNINALLCQYIHTLGEAPMTSKSVSEDMVSTLISILDISDTNEIYMKYKCKLNYKVRAVIVICLGKLSLKDYAVAKSAVPVFGTLVANKCPTQIKINSMIALTDLCTRFTSLVEVYIGDMCVCLKDKDSAVRKSALNLLVQLIKEDYVKLRSPYFFYILSLIDDVSEEIKEETLCFIINYAKVKQKSIMLSFFINSLFFFNDYEGEKICTTVAMQSPQERAVFCFSGKKQKLVRQRFYRFMLEHMEDDYRWKAIYKLAVDILSDIVQDKIILDDTGLQLLEDALFCIACDEMRLVNMSRSSDLHDDEVNAHEIVKKIRDSNLVLECLKRTYTDHVLPVLLELKQKLSTMKSPLLRNLRVALREMMKGFKKDEIYTLLSNDPVAAAEIEFELSRIESEKEAQLTPSAQRHRKQEMKKYETLLVQSEQLFNEVAKVHGDNLPLAIENVEEDSVEVPNHVLNKRNEGEEDENAVNASQQLLDGDNVCDKPESNSRTSGQNISSTDSSVHLNQSEKTSDGKHSSLSTAYGDSSVSMLPRGSTDTSTLETKSNKKMSACKKMKNINENTDTSHTSNNGSTSSSIKKRKKEKKFCRSVK